MIGVDKIKWYPRFDHWKRDILFFDQIAVVRLKGYMWVDWDELSDREKECRDEVQFLIEMGLVRHTDTPPPAEGAVGPDPWRELIYIEREIDRGSKEENLANGTYGYSQESADASEHEVARASVRAEVTNLNAIGVEAIGMREPLISIPSAADTTKPDVLNLILNDVALPSELSTWQDILELRADEDLMRRARKLRLWITDSVKSGERVGLIVERYQDLRSDYEAAFRAHKQKHTLGSIRAIIVDCAEFVEDIAKLRLGKLVARGVGIGAGRADLALAEMGLPGQAVSYVTHLNEKLR